MVRTRTIRPIATPDDYALFGDPGASRIARIVRDDPARARGLTTRGNTVAVISDGSDAPGLGAIGAEAELPLVEGKVVAYSSLARLNAVPLVIAARDLSQLIETIVAISPTFAGIHLTDIAAPRCFHILDELRFRVGVPVLDEQVQALPIVILAALHNALSIVCKRLEHTCVVIGGATRAAAGAALLLAYAGVGDVLVVDDGIVRTDFMTGSPLARALEARYTQRSARSGTLPDALGRADVYLRFRPDGIDNATLSSMAPDPIVFSLGDAAIDDDESDAIARHATISAGARTSDANMLTSALAFPGVMRGMIEYDVDHLDLATAASVALALAGGVAGQVDTDRLLPTLSDTHLPDVLAGAVGRQARSGSQLRAPVADRPRG